MTFAEYLESKVAEKKIIILRHDVDCRPEQALKMARLEHEMGIKASFYFRYRRRRFSEKVIGAVADLGHEIGYHYEDLRRTRGDAQKAIAVFRLNLEKLRCLAQVKTICMHGSPIFRFDNRDLWNSNDYHDFGIIGDPYFDIDVKNVLYLTDTGRKWDGDRVSVRDKMSVEGFGVMEKREDGGQKSENKVKDKRARRGLVCYSPGLRLHSTRDIINSLERNRLPNKFMLTVHPQRWTDEWIPWVGELVGQKIKNVVKYF